MTKHLKKELRNVLGEDARLGKLSRRDFMRISMAAGMSVSAASGL